ncbi:hypothetical protein FE275_11290 [Pseudomonas koreensis]|jgi:hypothetical protein|uniref:hypothetical protein n=1 Tax=Pseudomonas TaxID=286 RepID=UPI00123B6F90|nr:hypothetical protein [Pseudomonas koreensis]KAA8740526.1 hypothetical protein FE275_11290 [Pseudomonas koreensis]
MAKNLEQLVIKEAVGGIVKMTDVPEGATAQIPPGFLAESDHIPFFVQVSLDGTWTGERFSGTTPYSETIEIKVPREDLLEHAGPQGAKFAYVVNLGGNEVDAPFTEYKIIH